MDAAVDHAWDRLRGDDTVDRLMFGLTEAANHSVLWAALGAAHSLPREDRRARGTRFAVTMIGESLVVNGPIKLLVLRPRPVPRVGKWSLRTPRTSSFPSGHASAAFCAAVLLSDDSQVPTAVWYGLAGAVAASRVHVGIHWMADTVGGSLIGFAIGKAALKLAPLPAGDDG
ncbi:MAG: phosphatase PAP2 family protein [Microthrixaceae bacterium]